MDVPQGAEEADGEALRRVVRDQIGRGADVIKVYADNARGPTFSVEELRLIVETARTPRPPGLGPRHDPRGDGPGGLGRGLHDRARRGGDLEVFRLMAARGVAFCPTLTVFEATARFRGYRPGVDPEPARLDARPGPPSSSPWTPG